MPFDIERAGWDLRQATHLITGLILMLFHRSMAGTVMPFDLERAGRDLRQATCLRTNQNLGRFGYYYATGQERK